MDGAGAGFSTSAARKFVPTFEPYPAGMARVLVTGMSGTGKSAALLLLAERGHRAVDTDTDEWSRWVSLPDGSADWIWREEALTALLTSHASHDADGHLFVSGCKTNQGQFYSLFEHIVLLSAPADVLLSRIAARTSNPYGKRPDERALILRYLAEVEPQLRASATAEIDASAPLPEVVRQLEALAGPVRDPSRATCRPR
jgi:NAD(P)-dependent dehydrogenase (short-subunit alcohol dehydrogenase family)